MALKLYTGCKTCWQVYKVQIAASYAGKTLELAEVSTLDAKAQHPLGKGLVLQTPCGCHLFEANAVARYIARGTPVYGKTEFEAALVDQWVEFAAAELELPLAAWLLPYTVTGFARVEAAEKRAKTDVRKALVALNNHLATRTFFVGERVTLADIAVATTLLEAYKVVLDAGFRKELRNLNRWFVTVINQPLVAAVIGEVHLAEKAPVPPKVEEVAHEAPKAKEEKPKKEAKPKEEKPKKKKEEEDAGDDEDEVHEEKKAPNPLDALPPSKFVMDTWKRTYSNEDTKTVALPWFYENYDSAGFSLWHATYKDTLDCPDFMAANLIGGFIQRLEGMRKYGFGSLIIFGEAAPWKVEAVFLFRGTEIPFEMKDCPDFESYDFRRLELPAEKKLFEEFLSWEGDFDGKKFNQGKIYK